MRKSELLRRIEELERRLAWAEQRLAVMPSCYGVVATAELPLCPYPMGEGSALTGTIDLNLTAAVPLCPNGAPTCAAPPMARHSGQAMCIGAASASRH